MLFGSLNLNERVPSLTKILEFAFPYRTRHVHIVFFQNRLTLFSFSKIHKNDSMSSLGISKTTSTKHQAKILKRKTQFLI